MEQTICSREKWTTCYNQRIFIFMSIMGLLRNQHSKN